MKIIKEDKKQENKEQEKQKKERGEEKQREHYLSNLRKNKSFQKYVIKEIFDEKIKEMETINDIVENDYEEMGKLVLVKKATLIQLNKIREELVEEGT